MRLKAEDQKSKRHMFFFHLSLAGSGRARARTIPFRAVKTVFFQVRCRDIKNIQKPIVLVNKMLPPQVNLCLYLTVVYAIQMIAPSAPSVRADFAASLRLSWGISLIILAIFTHCSQNMLWALLGMWGCCSAFHVFPNWFEAKSPLSFARLKPSDDERTEISKKISWILRHGAKKAWESPHYWNSCCNMLKPNHES